MALFDELKQRNEVLEAEAREKDKTLKTFLGDKIRANLLDQKRTREMAKLRSTLEEEVQTRLEFEQKINKLSNYNRKLITEAKFAREAEAELKDKNDQLELKIKDISEALATCKVRRQEMEAETSQKSIELEAKAQVAVLAQR
jgi:hypothetical protein